MNFNVFDRGSGWRPESEPTDPHRLDLAGSGALFRALDAAAHRTDDFIGPAFERWRAQALFLRETGCTGLAARRHRRYHDRMSLAERLQGLLDEGKDGAPLRVSLAQACLGRGDTADAITHLERAVAMDPAYTAAWKTYGRALAMARRDKEARDAYRRGIAAARAAGDRQAEREMKVFLRRLEK